MSLHNLLSGKRMVISGQGVVTFLPCFSSKVLISCIVISSRLTGSPSPNVSQAWTVEVPLDPGFHVQLGSIFTLPTPLDEQATS